MSLELLIFRLVFVETFFYSPCRTHARHRNMENNQMLPLFFNIFFTASPAGIAFYFILKRPTFRSELRYYPVSRESEQIERIKRTENTQEIGRMARGLELTFLL